MSKKSESKGHYVYKYVLDGEIIYIGKNNTNLIDRINQHTIEKKFQENADAVVYYAELKNSVESGTMELLLINKYKPKLNIASVQEGLSIDFTEPEWKLYNPRDFKREDRLSEPFPPVPALAVPEWIKDANPAFAMRYKESWKKFAYGTCRLCGATTPFLAGIDWSDGFTKSFCYHDNDDERGWENAIDFKHGKNYHGITNTTHSITCCKSCYEKYLRPVLAALHSLEDLKVPIREQYAEESKQIQDEAVDEVVSLEEILQRADDAYREQAESTGFPLLTKQGKSISQMILDAFDGKKGDRLLDYVYD